MAEETGSRFRSLQGPIDFIWKLALFLIPIAGLLYILGIHQHLRMSLYQEQYIGIFLALLLFGIFIGIPATRKSAKDKVPWYDWILGGAGLIVGFYMAIYYPQMVLEYGYVTTERVVISIVAFVLIVEALRRMVGWILVTIVSLFLLYAFIAPYMPGVFNGSRTSTPELFNYLYMDSNSIVGLLGIAATIALAFILFGNTLLIFKGGDIINDFSMISFGRFRGGPAKASVVGSSLVGSITGGPVTNVLLTGNVTIPLMKRNGHSSVEAGAVESVASTGGQIMPPVMGVAAFVIAEYLGIPYAEVALAALIPAVLFYLCVFFQVDLLALRKGLLKIPKDKLPLLKDLIRKGWVIIPPFVFLIYSLFVIGYTPSLAGVYSALIALVFLLLLKAHRENLFRRFISIFTKTGEVLLEVGIVLAAAGLVVGITGITGLGFNLAMLLTQLGEYGLFILLVVSAIVSIILGMGMPSVAAYTLVAVLVAPALVELGVEPIAAHLFVFYFSILSNFTPPIALACFAAAPIAKASANRIGFRAVKLGISAYIVPFIFVYSPNLLLQYDMDHSYLSVAGSLIIAIFACLLLSISAEGYFYRNLGYVKRIVLAGLSILLFMPIELFSQVWLTNVLAGVIAVGVLISEWWLNRKIKDKGGMVYD